MKRFVLFVTSAVLSLSMMAGVVDRNMAREKAMKFMPGKRFVESKPFASARAQEPEKPDAFYIFNTEGNQGYVIISGDDRTQEVLGYAEHGNLDEATMPENMKWWLENLAAQIKALDTSLKPAAKNAARASRSAISPMLKAQWGQDEPFNYMCPDGNHVDFDEEGYDAKNRSITGCVATAMAQVMYYWQWPSTCDGIKGYSMGHWENHGTDENPDWQFIEVCKIHDLPATTFEWDKMKPTYESYETGEAADAVAKLMRYCGQASNMEYSPEMSGTHLYPSAMVMFGYNKDCRELSRDNYTSANWEDMVYQELAEGRPVLYSGQSANDGGHQFVVDGYRSDGLYHMNWGWRYEGSYSVLTVADYSNENGVSGSQNKNAFQFYQSALFGVRPAEEGEVMHPAFYAYIDEFETAEYTRASADVDFTGINLNAFMNGEYNMDPTEEIGVEVGWGLYQNNELISCLSSFKTMLPLYARMNLDHKATVLFGAGLPEGKYLLSQMYRFNDSDEWTQCIDSDIYSLVAEVGATTLTVRRQQMAAEVLDLTTTTEPMVGRPLEVVVNATNTGELPSIILRLYAQPSDGNDKEILAEEDFFVNPGATDDVHFYFTPLTAGDFTWQVTGVQDEELYSGSITVSPSNVVIPDFCTYDEGEVCAFFESPAEWENTIHCWAWIDSPAENFTGGAWPGVACELLGTASNGNKVWKWSWDGYKQNDTEATLPEKIIFNNYGQPQTGDLLFVLHGYYNEYGVQGEVITAIHTLPATTKADGKVYSLDGRLLRTDGTTARLAKGVYIVNGRKVVVK